MRANSFLLRGSCLGLRRPYKVRQDHTQLWLFCSLLIEYPTSTLVAYDERNDGDGGDMRSHVRSWKLERRRFFPLCNYANPQYNDISLGSSNIPSYFTRLKNRTENGMSCQRSAISLFHRRMESSEVSQLFVLWINANRRLKTTLQCT